MQRRVRSTGLLSKAVSLRGHGKPETYKPCGIAGVQTNVGDMDNEADGAASARPHEPHWRLHPEGKGTVHQARFCFRKVTVRTTWKMEKRGQKEQLGDQAEDH